MSDNYIPLGPGENARFIRGSLVDIAGRLAGTVLQFDGDKFVYVSPGGSTGIGDVVGPASSTDNALVRYDGTTGKLLKDSNILIDDSDNMTAVNSLTVVTLVATDTITTGDNMIVLNDEVAGAPSEDAGIEINRGSSTDARHMWNETSDRWEGGLVGSLSKYIREVDLISPKDTISISASNIDARMLIANGLEDKTKFTISYAEGTRVITLNVAASAVYWSNGTRYQPAEADIEMAAHADTTGDYWLVYIDGTLTVTTTPNIDEHALLSTIYYNDVTKEGILWDERHPNDWSSHIHEYVHSTRGAVLESGGLISDYTLDTFDAVNYAVSTCVFDDESYGHTLTSLPSGGPYSVWYRSGTDANGEWTWDITPTIPVLDDGDDIYYNLLNGGSWALTEVTNNYYVNYWLFGTSAYNDSGDNYKHRFIQIVGENQYQFEAGALSEDINTNITWGSNIPIQELVPLYRLTYKCPNNGSGKDIKLTTVTRIAGQGLVFISSGNPTEHNALSGRSEIASHPASAISVNADVTANLVSIDAQSAFVELADEIAIRGPLALVEGLHGFIPAPTDVPYILELASPYAGNLNALSVNTSTGTLTANVTIDGVVVNGCSEVAVTSTNQRVLSSNALNSTISANSVIELIISGTSSAENLAFSVTTTRT